MDTASASRPDTKTDAASDGGETIRIPEGAIVTDELDAPDAERHSDRGEQPETYGRRSLWYVARKSLHEFSDDQGTDLAASLTYYAVLAIFPAALALVSLIGVFSNGQHALNEVLDILRPIAPGATVTHIHDVLKPLVHSSNAIATLIVGVLGALWSASAYISAFGRMMNRVYEVEEGRAFWRLRPLNLILTLVAVVLAAAAVVIMVVSGPVASSVGAKLGLGTTAINIWNIAKWPVLLVIVIAIVAMLYHFTPNVKLGKFRPFSPGAVVAILGWVVASVLFGLYVANFSSYDKVYGSVAGAIVVMLWLWITNVALVFGAELDSEMERARELHRGTAAEERLQLPLRSARGVEKARVRRERDIAAGREVRASRAGAGDPGDRPF